MSSKAYREGYAAIKWTPLTETKKTTSNTGPSGPFLMPDIQPFVSPLDFTVVSSRSALREHERKHGVRQCGELKSATDFSNEQRKAEAFNQRAFDNAFRQTVEKLGL